LLYPIGLYPFCNEANRAKALVTQALDRYT
jgi:hypothetical protein